MTRHLHPVLALLLLAPLAGCGRKVPPGVPDRKGVSEVEPLKPGRAVAGQIIYVPAYPSVYTADRAARYNLAVMLSLRNTDRLYPIVVTSVRFYDHDGRPVHDYVKKPLRIQPMAAMEFFVQESDTRGGVSASFLVKWVAEERVDAPVVESVMVGTASNQGVSFTCPGRVLHDRAISGLRPELEDHEFE